MFSASLLFLAAIYDQRNMLRIQRRHLRDSTNPFEIPNERFMELFRFDKRTAKLLIEELKPFMKQGRRKTFIPIHIKICAALHFYATGSCREDIGKDFIHSMSKTMAVRAISEVSDVLQNNLMNKWIQFPGLNKYDDIKLRFLEKTGFPGVVGAIDCTHIRMYTLEKDLLHGYVNRKGYCSKNVQLICDFDLNILGVNARYGGAYHDASIWDSSAINRILEERYSHGQGEETWLLGDSAYPLQPWLMVPFKNASTDAEIYYNHKHSQARNCIKRLNGVLKTVFRCLHSELRANPVMAGKIINSCCVLHNFRRKYGLRDDVVAEIFEIESDAVEGTYPDSRSYLAEGRRLRNNLANSFSRV